MSPREMAVILLRNLLKPLYEGCGLQWGTEDDADIERIVDAIIQAAIEP